MSKQDLTTGILATARRLLELDVNKPMDLILITINQAQLAALFKLLEQENEDEQSIR